MSAHFKLSKQSHKSFGGIESCVNGNELFLGWLSTNMIWLRKIRRKIAQKMHGQIIECNIAIIWCKYQKSCLFGWMVSFFSVPNVAFSMTIWKFVWRKKRAIEWKLKPGYLNVLRNSLIRILCCVFMCVCVGVSFDGKIRLE